jgi:Tfp pilus tip-associated adhesin PilY1
LPLAEAEKVLSKAITIDGAIIFLTYQPTPAQSGCMGTTGLNRVYSLDAVTALKKHETPFESVSASGLPRELRFIVESIDEREGQCWAGIAKLQRCIDIKRIRRTGWKLERSK